MTSTIISILSLLAICGLPFFILSLRRKKMDKLALQSLLAHPLAKDNPITRHDIHRNFVIGLSENTNSILFKRQKDNLDKIQLVDLNCVASCKADRFTRSSVDGKYTTMGKIELRFQMAVPSPTETIFVLYNMDDDSLNVTDEFLLAEKWCTIANSRLKVARS